MALASDRQGLRVDPSMFVTPNAPVVEPRAVMALTEAFRSGQIRAEEVADRALMRPAIQAQVTAATDPQLVELKRRGMVADVQGAELDVQAKQAALDNPPLSKDYANMADELQAKGVSVNRKNPGEISSTWEDFQNYQTQMARAQADKSAFKAQEISDSSGVRVVPMQASSLTVATPAEAGRLQNLAQEMAAAPNYNAWKELGSPKFTRVFETLAPGTASVVVPRQETGTPSAAVVAGHAPGAWEGNVFPRPIRGIPGEGTPPASSPTGLTIPISKESAAPSPELLKEISAAPNGSGVQALDKTVGTQISGPKAGADGTLTLPEQAAKTVLALPGAFGALDQINATFRQYAEGSDVPDWAIPIVGVVRSNNPYDVDAKALNAAVDAAVPLFARSIFQEVGVLTDRDVARYRSLLPNPSTTAERAEVITKLLAEKLTDTTLAFTSVYGGNPAVAKLKDLFKISDEDLESYSSRSAENFQKYQQYGGRSDPQIGTPVVPGLGKGKGSAGGSSSPEGKRIPLPKGGFGTYRVINGKGYIIPEAGPQTGGGKPYVPGDTVDTEKERIRNLVIERK